MKLRKIGIGIPVDKTGIAIYRLINPRQKKIYYVVQY